MIDSLGSKRTAAFLLFPMREFNEFEIDWCIVVIKTSKMSSEIELAECVIFVDCAAASILPAQASAECRQEAASMSSIYPTP